MAQVFGSCSRYVQGFRELDNIGKYIGWMGKTFLIVASKNRLREYQDRLGKTLGSKYDLLFAQFGGESDRAEVERLVGLCKGKACDGVIGIGGGKVADTVKCVAYEMKTRLIIVPTTAASDAYTSHVGLLYKDGVINEEVQRDQNPDVVLVDTEIIMNSPVRLFVSGLGDTLSTYIGGKVCYDGYKNTHFDALGTETGLAVAKCSYDTIMKYGRQAVISAHQKVMTPAYNKVIEANILMSGLGFENNGSASDHIFFFGIESLAGREHYCYHGEGVAFSTCCQLVMQGASNEQLDEVYGFLRDVGLPITLEDMRMTGLTDEEYGKMAEFVCGMRFAANHPFKFTKEGVIGAYKTADKIGQMYKNGQRLV